MQKGFFAKRRKENPNYNNIPKPPTLTHQKQFKSSVINEDNDTCAENNNHYNLIPNPSLSSRQFLSQNIDNSNIPFTTTITKANNRNSDNHTERNNFNSCLVTSKSDVGFENFPTTITPPIPTIPISRDGDINDYISHGSPDSGYADSPKGFNLGKHYLIKGRSEQRSFFPDVAEFSNSVSSSVEPSTLSSSISRQQLYAILPSLSNSSIHSSSSSLNYLPNRNTFHCRESLSNRSESSVIQRQSDFTGTQEVAMNLCTPYSLHALGPGLVTKMFTPYYIPESHSDIEESVSHKGIIEKENDVEMEEEKPIDLSVNRPKRMPTTTEKHIPLQSPIPPSVLKKLSSPSSLYSNSDIEVNSKKEKEGLDDNEEEGKEMEEKETKIEQEEHERDVFRDYQKLRQFFLSSNQESDKDLSEPANNENGHSDIPDSRPPSISPSLVQLHLHPRHKKLRPQEQHKHQEQHYEKLQKPPHYHQQQPRIQIPSAFQADALSQAVYLNSLSPYALHAMPLSLKGHLLSKLSPTFAFARNLSYNKQHQNDSLSGLDLSRDCETDEEDLEKRSKYSNSYSYRTNHKASPNTDSDIICPKLSIHTVNQNLTPSSSTESMQIVSLATSPLSSSSPPIAFPLLSPSVANAQPLNLQKTINYDQKSCSFSSSALPVLSSLSSSSAVMGSITSSRKRRNSERSDASGMKIDPENYKTTSTVNNSGNTAKTITTTTASAIITGTDTSMNQTGLNLTSKLVLAEPDITVCRKDDENVVIEPALAAVLGGGVVVGAGGKKGGGRGKGSTPKPKAKSNAESTPKSKNAVAPAVRKFTGTTPPSSKKMKAVRKLNFDVDTTSPVSGTIIKEASEFHPVRRRNS